MAEKKKQGFLKKIFGGGNKSCCSMELEEVTDKSTEQKIDDKKPCCDSSDKKVHQVDEKTGCCG